MKPEPTVATDPLLDCPTCGLPAEITDRFMLYGVPSPVEHVKLVCVRGHWYTPPFDQLVVTEPDGHEPRHTAVVIPPSATAIRQETTDGGQ
jgi:hypothetical protein